MRYTEHVILDLNNNNNINATKNKKLKDESDDGLVNGSPFKFNFYFYLINFILIDFILLKIQMKTVPLTGNVSLTRNQPLLNVIYLNSFFIYFIKNTEKLNKNTSLTGIQINHNDNFKYSKQKLQLRIC